MSSESSPPTGEARPSVQDNEHHLSDEFHVDVPIVGQKRKHEEEEIDSNTSTSDVSDCLSLNQSIKKARTTTDTPPSPDTESAVAPVASRKRKSIEAEDDELDTDSDCSPVEGRTFKKARSSSFTSDTTETRSTLPSVEFRDDAPKEGGNVWHNVSDKLHAEGMADHEYSPVEAPQLTAEDGVAPSVPYSALSPDLLPYVPRQVVPAPQAALEILDLERVTRKVKEDAAMAEEKDKSICSARHAEKGNISAVQKDDQSEEAIEACLTQAQKKAARQKFVNSMLGIEDGEQDSEEDNNDDATIRAIAAVAAARARRHVWTREDHNGDVSRSGIQVGEVAVIKPTRRRGDRACDLFHESRGTLDRRDGKYTARRINIDPKAKNQDRSLYRNPITYRKVYDLNAVMPECYAEPKPRTAGKSRKAEDDTGVSDHRDDDRLVNDRASLALASKTDRKDSGRKLGGIPASTAVADDMSKAKRQNDNISATNGNKTNKAQITSTNNIDTSVDSLEDDVVEMCAPFTMPPPPSEAEKAEAEKAKKARIQSRKDREAKTAQWKRVSQLKAVGQCLPV